MRVQREQDEKARNAEGRGGIETAVFAIDAEKVKELKQMRLQHEWDEKVKRVDKRVKQRDAIATRTFREREKRGRLKELDKKTRKERNAEGRGGIETNEIAV